MGCLNSLSQAIPQTVTSVPCPSGNVTVLNGGSPISTGNPLSVNVPNIQGSNAGGVDGAQSALIGGLNFTGTSTEVVGGDQSAFAIDPFRELNVTTNSLIPTFFYADNFVPDFTTGSGIFAQICGNASKSVLIKNIDLSMASTASTSSNAVIDLERVKTPETGGTVVSVIGSPAQGSATSATDAQYFTVIPTTTTPTGTNYREIVYALAPSAPTFSPRDVDLIGPNNGQPIVLAGVNDCLLLNFVGGSISASISLNFITQEF
jgi:hypothetical protein